MTAKKKTGSNGKKMNGEQGAADLSLSRSLVAGELKKKTRSNGKKMNGEEGAADLSLSHSLVAGELKKKTRPNGKKMNGEEGSAASGELGEGEGQKKGVVVVLGFQVL
ncbi:integrase [Sesbania bispinosa]|nr:integrase [Sesbania bispinosa]